MRRLLKWIWSGMVILGIVLGAASGRLEEVGAAMLKSAASSAQLALSLIGVYALWLGLLGVAREAGVISALSRRLRGAVGRLMGGLRGEAVGYITMNLVANMLGMGNAATPFGLRAMAALQSENPDKKRPSDAMCIFLILNTASVQLLPLSVIAVRAACGAAEPADIVLPAFLATLSTAVIGTAIGKLCIRFKKR